MEKRTSLDDEIVNFQKINSSDDSINNKLDELIALLETSKLDSNTVNKIKDKFNNAVSRVEFSSENIKEFQQLDESTASRLELADSLETLLSQYQLDSRVSKKIVFTERLVKVTTLILGIIFITFGFAMIIMPAPPYFEMFTIFHFTRDDGFTLMDLISLIIVFTGVYLFITSIVKMKRLE
ncbi:MAG: hypothetical protein H7Y07_09760 [Pyrinomonadaceae bacterium]|nr:hypothetical protein [Sphingobacteriaceae bacterium]